MRVSLKEEIPHLSNFFVLTHVIRQQFSGHEPHPEKSVAVNC